MRRSGPRPALISRPEFRLNPGQVEANRLLGSGARHVALVGGSRSGKTFVACRAIMIRALAAPGSRHLITRFRYNACRASIGLDTLPKMAELCFPDVRLRERVEGYYELPNSSEIWLGGLDDKERVDKILGNEYATIFGNETSQISYPSWLVALSRLAQVCHLPDGRRLRQMSIVDLNPTGKQHWTNLLYGMGIDPVTRNRLPDPENYVRTFLNPDANRQNLDPAYLASLAALPDRARRRFYEGVYQEEVDGALWTYELLDETRVDDEDCPRELRKRVVVAVDPSGAGSSDQLTSDEIGIVGAALGQDGHGYVLADRTLRAGPSAWAAEAVGLARRLEADCIVAEVNFGGAMVESTIRTVDPNIRIKLVTASRGKAVRAEPIASLYSLKKVHHVGRLSALEDELCGFSESGYTGDRSPNRADAAVWALTELMGVSNTTGLLEYMKRTTQEQQARANA